MKKILLILLILFCLFALAQLIRPTIINPPVTQDVQVPDSVKAILQKGCYDCHSNQTDLKWFDKITPVNFLVAGHIRDGRKALNFSHWDSLAPADRKSKLFWAINDIRNGEMPLSSYLLAHSGARIDSNEAVVFEHYLAAVSPYKVSDSIALHAIDTQYAQIKNHPVATIQPEWNGIAFLKGFDHWVAISTTERFDNNSLRVIYGNDIAVKAISENHINPWPDGTAFAKAAWKEKSDSLGNIATGEFLQVEFMIKDSKQYAATKGWGWARWRGTDLKPYGKDAGFTSECTTCHRPVKDNDFVFTYPIAFGKASDFKNTSLNNSAALPQGLAFDPLQGEVVNTYINDKERTTATLYRVKQTSSNILTLVTWQQQPDPRWFGARIPASSLAVEVVGADSTYQYYAGSPLQLQTTTNTAERKAWMLTQKPMLLPQVK